jgi:hypothetical protein
VDLLESGDERENRPLGSRLRSVLTTRLPAWAVAGVAVLLLGALGGGMVAAAQVSDSLAREAARVEVTVQPIGSSSSTVAGVARGEIELLLVNRREQRVRLGELRVEVEGLRVLRTEPAFGRPLGPFEDRLFRIAFEVRSCTALVLPGTLSVSLLGEGQPLERREVPVYDAAEPGPVEGLALGACPPSARGADPGTPTDVGVRSAGGAAMRQGAGATGFARLEVRNDGRPLRLLSVTAQVPGVAFSTRTIDGGRTIGPDGLVIVRLAFTVADCARLRPAGRVVLRIERFDGVQELGLRAVADPEASAGPQVNLQLVLGSCD